MSESLYDEWVNEWMYENECGKAWKVIGMKKYVDLTSYRSARTQKNWDADILGTEMCLLQVTRWTPNCFHYVGRSICLSLCPLIGPLGNPPSHTRTLNNNCSIIIAHFSCFQLERDGTTVDVRPTDGQSLLYSCVSATNKFIRPMLHASALSKKVRQIDMQTFF